MRARLGVLVGVVALVLAAACGSGSSPSRSGSGKRPSTTARVQIVSPTAGETTGPNVTLKVNVIGAIILPPAQVTGPLRPDQGHIHVSVDGSAVQMSFGTDLSLTNLAPGPHTVLVEFVAVDHQSFANRVTAAVVFQVKGS